MGVSVGQLCGAAAGLREAGWRGAHTTETLPGLAGPADELAALISGLRAVVEQLEEPGSGTGQLAADAHLVGPQQFGDLALAQTVVEAQ